jgi:hypothetical protein
MFQPLPLPCDASTNSLAGATGSRGGKKQENTKIRQRERERERERERGQQHKYKKGFLSVLRRFW